MTAEELIEELKKYPSDTEGMLETLFCELRKNGKFKFDKNKAAELLNKREYSLAKKQIRRINRLKSNMLREIDKFERKNK